MVAQHRHEDFPIVRDGDVCAPCKEQSEDEVEKHRYGEYAALVLCRKRVRVDDID